jgi:hypothetical protein
MKGGGGRRERAGRPPGSRNKRTRETVERVATAAAADELEDVVVLLTKWANDPAKDDHFRAACAGKAAEFTHSKPSRLPERLPLPHEIPEWMLEDFEKRLKEDQARNPARYGLPRPKPKLVVGKKSRPPSDRWFAEMSSTTDERRHAGGPRPWAPGERERLLQTPFYPDELASLRIYEQPNGGDSDPAT